MGAETCSMHTICEGLRLYHARHNEYVTHYTAVYSVRTPERGTFLLYFNIPNIEVHFFRYPLSDIPRLYVSCYGLCAARLPVSEAIP